MLLGLVVGLFNRPTVHSWKKMDFSQKTFSAHFAISTSVRNTGITSSTIAQFSAQSGSGTQMQLPAPIVQQLPISTRRIIRGSLASVALNSSEDPSTCTSHPWLAVEHPVYSYEQSDGKWLMFFPDAVIDERWRTAKERYLSGLLPGISSMKVTTKISSPRTSTTSLHSIMFFCGPANDEGRVVQIGQILASQLPPESDMFYKANNSQNPITYGNEEAGHVGSGLGLPSYLYHLPLQFSPEVVAQLQQVVAPAVAEPAVVKRIRKAATPKVQKRVPLSPKKPEEPAKPKTGYILVFDTETTGFPPGAPPTYYHAWERCRMVELAWHVYTYDKKVVTKSQFLIKPEFNYQIPRGAVQVHGITNAKAEKQGKPLDFVLEQFHLALDNVDYLVGHNVNFDVRVVTSEIARKQRHDLLDKFRQIPTKCTMSMGQRIMEHRKRRKLAILYEECFGSGPSGILHRADADVAVCADIFFHLLPREVEAPPKKQRKKRATM